MHALTKLAIGVALAGSGCRTIFDLPDPIGIDGGTVDAAPPVGLHNHYVIAHERAPVSAVTGSLYGLDLDGDANVDNALAKVGATLSAMGFDVEGETNRLVDRGTILMLLDLQTTDFMTATAVGLTVIAGANARPAPCTSDSDGVCRHHLDGTGLFDRAVSPAAGPALVGSIEAGVYTTPVSPASRVTLETDFAGVGRVDLPLIGVRAKATGMTGMGLTSVTIAGAIEVSAMTGVVLPALVAGYNAAIDRDCARSVGPPTCGCLSASTGQITVALLDGNVPSSQRDCTITMDEVQRNTVLQPLFAPDVMIDGRAATSVGFQFDAVVGKFPP